MHFWENWALFLNHLVTVLVFREMSLPARGAAIIVSLFWFQVNSRKRRKQDNNIAKELRMMGHGEHAQTGLTTK